jgi:threonine dehydrogenase-like Zn-dependent dehydrogenase
VSLPQSRLYPSPSQTPGSVVIRILVANVVSYAREIYDGTRPYTFPLPLVIGSSAIGRIAATGRDATLLTPGQLVFFDITIRGRDDPAHSVFLSGVVDGFTAGSKKLMAGEWRDSTYAEYAKVPLENCHVLNEKLLLGSVKDGGLGYSVESLSIISRLLVPYGGLRDVNLKVGETVIVAPATGPFGGVAVVAALAMGARVVAMGRNVDALNKLEALDPKRVKTVPITGDVEGQTKAVLSYFRPADVFFDISPPQAAKSTHIKSAILALRHGGRVSLMGGIQGDVSIPYNVVMHSNILLKGTWMFPREAVGEVIKMVETDVLRIGEESLGQRHIAKFGLEEWDQAFTAAAENTGMGDLVLIAP